MNTNEPANAPEATYPLRLFPWVGLYGEPAVAPTVGNFMIMDAVTLLHYRLDEVLAMPRDVKLVVQLHILDEVWADPSWEWVQLWHIRAGLIAHGLWERTVALIVDEEQMLKAYASRANFERFGGDATSADPFRRIDWCHARWSNAVRKVKQVFPDRFVGAMETCWTTRRDHGAEYYRPPIVECDFLGLDAYVNGPLHWSAFAHQVLPIYREAEKLNKDLLIVGQAFTDESRQMPTGEQMRWWVDCAPSRTVALAWFSGHALNLPEHRGQLAAAQWYWQQHFQQYKEQND